MCEYSQGPLSPAGARQAAAALCGINQCPLEAPLGEYGSRARIMSHPPSHELLLRVAPRLPVGDGPPAHQGLLARPLANAPSLAGPSLPAGLGHARAWGGQNATWAARPAMSWLAAAATCPPTGCVTYRRPTRACKQARSPVSTRQTLPALRKGIHYTKMPWQPHQMLVSRIEWVRAVVCGAVSQQVDTVGKGTSAHQT